MPVWVEQIEWDSLIPLGVAILLGGLIGLERELNRKPAGLRTNILICLGAALLTQIAVRVDPDIQSATRIIQGVITGIGFIGAGVLIHSGGDVHGLTSAATVWLVTAIGIAVGLGLYTVAVASAIAVLIVLIAFSPLDRKIHKKHPGPNGNDNKDRPL